MANIYATITPRQMRRLINTVGRFRYTGDLHGDARRYTRSNGRVDVLFYWHETEDLPRSVSIKPVTLTSKPTRTYKITAA